MRVNILFIWLIVLQISMTASADEAGWPHRWVNSLTVGDGTVYACAPDGLLLRESAVCAFSASDPTQSETLYKHPVSVWAVVQSPDGKLLASSDYKGNLATFDLQSKKLDLKESVLERWTRALAFSKDGKHLIAGNEAGKVFAYSLEKGEVEKSVELDGQQIYALAVSPDGNSVAACDGAGHVHLLKFPSLEASKEIACGSEPVWALAFTADGNGLLVGGADRQLRHVSVTEEKEPKVLGKTTDWITSIASNSAGQQFAIGTMDGTMYTSDGVSLEKVGKTPSAVWSVAYAGDHLLAATRKHMVATFVPSWKIGYTAPDEVIESKE